MLPHGLVPLFLDFESAFDEKTYTLKKLSITEYIRDPRFRVHGFAVSWPGVSPRWVSAKDAAETLDGFDWDSVALVGHNLKFDGAILAWRYGIQPALYVDTLGLSMAVNGATVHSHALGALAEHWQLPAKGLMKTSGILRELTAAEEKELAEYCVHDVELTQEAYARLMPQFPESQYPFLDWTIRSFVNPKLLVDVPKMEAAGKAEAERRAAFFLQPGFEKSVFSSNQKFAALLEAEGYEVPMKKSRTAEKKGETKMIPALAVNDSAFIDMMESGDERLVDLCEARVAAKSTLFETRTGKLARVGATGPWPFDVVFSGAKQTHRLSGGSGAGGNPQNIPIRNPRMAVMREGIVAPDGHVILDGDFSQIEVRVLAWLAQDSALMATFLEGRDVYCDFASEYFSRPITKADVAERTFSKPAVLGLGYGMAEKKFISYARATIGRKMSDEEASNAKATYRRRYAMVPVLWNYLGDILPVMAAGGDGVISTLPCVRWDKDGFILPSGLRIRYPKLAKEGREWTYEAYRDRTKEPQRIKIYGGKMAENLCQALAGEICKEAILRLGGRPCGQVHDELLMVVLAEDAATAKAEMEKAMTDPLPWWPGLKLGCEVGVGKNWLEAHG